MRSIAVANWKGGSGKTTTALCLAVGMARRGLRTLLIDADSQGNASLTMLDGEAAASPTLGDVLLGRADADEAIRPTRAGGLSILPADRSLADAALLLADKVGREHRLRVALAGIAHRFDVAIVDCPPQLSLTTVNVLAAVGEVIVPVDAGIYSVAGLAELQRTVADVRQYLGNTALRVSGLVITRTHANRATRDIVEQLRAAYGPLVFKATIPHSVRVEEAHGRNLTVLEFAPTSTTARAYDDLTTEVLDDGEQRQGGESTVGADPADDAGRTGSTAGRGRGKRRAG
jgi:chromosome partitioning protein